MPGGVRRQPEAWKVISDESQRMQHGRAARSPLPPLGWSWRTLCGVLCQPWLVPGFGIRGAVSAIASERLRDL